MTDTRYAELLGHFGGHMELRLELEQTPLGTPEGYCIYCEMPLDDDTYYPYCGPRCAIMAETEES